VTEAAADKPTIAAIGWRPARAETRPGCDWLDLAAFAYLALPVILFLLGWLQWWIGIPLAALLLVVALIPIWSPLTAIGFMVLAALGGCSR